MSEAGAAVDVAVIGAGVNGAGIARDAAMRGLSVAVFDRQDLCSGTSAWSSRLIHGGLRYLEYAEIPLVFESLHERRYLLDIARHLVQPLAIAIPVFDDARRGRWLVRAGMLAYDLLSLGKNLPRHRMLGADDMLAEYPGLRADGLRGGARYFDAQVTFAERLVLENLLAARAAGADIRLWHEVTSIEVDNGRAQAIRYRDAAGNDGRVRARVVVNAAGPWVDSVLGLTGADAERHIGGTKGSHVVVSRFPGAPDTAFYVEAGSDGRPIFILPWNGLFLVGTTDIRYDGDPATVRASGQEIEYLLGETNRVFPGAVLEASDVHYAYAGIRPLPYRAAGPESAITRRHIIRCNTEIAGNLVSIIGGKLTTYRNLAEQVVDRVGKCLRRRLPACRTHDTPLPGAHGTDDAARELAALGVLSEDGLRRVAGLYGGRGRRVARLARDEAALAAPLDAGRTALSAEVALACREEFATTLVDVVFRRLMVGLSADQGRPLYGAIAGVTARELGWSAGTREEELRRLVAFADSLRVAAAGDQSAPAR